METNETNNGLAGGLLKGDSHKNGGIAAVVVDTGEKVELEGQEVIINKEAAKKHWKELSEINQSTGGVPIEDPNEQTFLDGANINNTQTINTMEPITVGATIINNEASNDEKKWIIAEIKDGNLILSHSPKFAHAKDNLTLPFSNFLVLFNDRIISLPSIKELNLENFEAEKILVELSIKKLELDQEVANLTRKVDEALEETKRAREELMGHVEKMEKGGNISEGNSAFLKIYEANELKEKDGFFPNYQTGDTYYLHENLGAGKIRYFIESKSQYSDVGSAFYGYDDNLNYTGSGSGLSHNIKLKTIRLTKSDFENTKPLSVFGEQKLDQSSDIAFDKTHAISSLNTLFPTLKGKERKEAKGKIKELEGTGNSDKKYLDNKENNAKIKALKKISGTKWTGTTIHDNMDKCLRALNNDSNNSGHYNPVATRIDGLTGWFMINEDGSIFCEARIIKEDEKQYKIEYMTNTAWNDFENLYSQFLDESTSEKLSKRTR